MTKAAKHYGKEVKHFWELESTKEYMVALGEMVGIPDCLVETAVGRNGGTWPHPKLAVFFAGWRNCRLLVFIRFVVVIVIVEFSRVFSQVIFDAFFAPFNE